MTLDNLNTKINTLRDEAAAIRRDFSTEIAALNANPSLTIAGKRELLDKIEPELRTKLANLDAEESKALEQTRQGLQRQITGNASEGDVVAFRDAHDRAGRLESEVGARNAITQALDVDDVELAKAILHKSMANGWTAAIDTYTAARPDMSGTIRDLTAVHRWSNSDEVSIERAMAYQLPEARLQPTANAAVNPNVRYR
ncbi:hypothetical protein [Microbacterium sp. 1.5R]|uniref:hypothetical protein n=1 Tax=Microbacterium sp. 1.5R TaxID=1916917 RepID=UPI0011AACC24|nr:hypothetical protein [Microbacterium sp. 1.5R]